MQHLRNRTPPNLYTIMQNLSNNTKRKGINLFARMRVLDHSIHNKQHINLPQEQPRTIYCFNCERSAHSTKDCIYQAYCRLCRNQHKRGTRKKCLGSKWKPLDETQPIPFKYILQSELEKIKNGTWNEPQPPRIQQQRKGPSRQNQIDFHTLYANAEDEEEEQDETYPHILNEIQLGPEENDPNLQYNFTPTPDQTHDPEEHMLNF